MNRIYRHGDRSPDIRENKSFEWSSCYSTSTTSPPRCPSPTTTQKTLSLYLFVGSFTSQETAETGRFPFWLAIGFVVTFNVEIDVWKIGRYVDVEFFDAWRVPFQLTSHNLIDVPKSEHWPRSACVMSRWYSTSGSTWLLYPSTHKQKRGKEKRKQFSHPRDAYEQGDCRSLWGNPLKVLTLKKRKKKISSVRSRLNKYQWIQAAAGGGDERRNSISARRTGIILLVARDECHTFRRRSSH